jgi:hypothetical protein
MVLRFQDLAREGEGDHIHETHDFPFLLDSICPPELA